MVVGAEPTEIVEGGRPVFGVIPNVVHFQVSADPAARDIALASLDEESCS